MGQRTIDKATALRATLALWATALSLVLLAAPASAAVTHPLLGSFGPDGTEASEFERRHTSLGGVFPGTGNQQLAFDRAQRLLYALVQVGDDPDERLDALCRFEPFDPETGTAPPDDFATKGAPCIDGFDLGFGGTFQETGLSVDNSSEPSAGNVYVTDRETSFSDGSPPILAAVNGVDGTDDGTGPGDGMLLGPPFPISGGEGGDLGSISAAAVGPEGCVWVPVPIEREIVVIDPTDPAGGTCRPAVDVSAQGRPNRLAFDAEGDLYLVTETGSVAAKEEIYRLSAPEYTSAVRIDPEGSGPVWAMAVDRAKDRLFVAQRTEVVEYDLGSVPEEPGSAVFEAQEVSRFGAGMVAGGGGGLRGFHGIAVDEATETIYLSNASNTRLIHVFGTETTEPIAVTFPPGEITATTALGQGTVDPQGSELSDCRFEAAPAGETLGGPATLEFPCETEHAEAIDEECTGAETPLSGPGEIPAEAGPVCLSAPMEGLAPGTEYRYRLSVTSAEDVGHGNVVDFKTKGPAIGETRAGGVAYTEANLAATIDPQGVDTAYRFEYGAAGPCSANPCASTPEVGIAAAAGPSAALAALGGLSEATTYYFRAIATYPEAEVTSFGPDRTFATYARPAGPDPDCPNAARRAGPSAALPECRAYEQVSPLEKGTADAIDAKAQAAAGGGSLAFRMQGGQILPGCEGGPEVTPVVSRLSDPATGSWSARCLATPLAVSEYGAYDFFYHDFSDDLAKMAYCSGASLGVPGGGEGLYLMDTATGASTWSGGDFEQTCAALAGATALLASPSYESLFFESPAQLAVDAGPAPPPGEEVLIYEWSEASGPGQCAGKERCLALASVDEAEAAVPGEIFAYRDRAVSADGSRVFWRCGAGDGASVCARSGGQTVEIGASERGVPDPAGTLEKTFVDASADGEVAFFVSGEKLTDDATASEGEASFAPGSGLAKSGSLYRYDFAAPAGERLTDITVVPDPGAQPAGAEVQGVVDASADGERIYFVALGALAPGAVAGKPNLYLWDGTGPEAVTVHVATLADLKVDRDNLNAYHSYPTPLASADGQRLIFGSAAPLAPGYDTANKAMLYLYDAPTDTLRCISCDPSGEAASADAALGQGGTPSNSLAGIINHQRRNLSADGRRAFFQTADALLPADVNGALDVYMWLDRDGSGEGSLHLISSGRSADDSLFVDASASGEDVFFTTRERLSPLDDDSQVDVYDARVGGAAALAPPKPSRCQGEACLPRAVVPDPLSGASAGFVGPGNLALVARGCSASARRARGLSRRARSLRAAARRAARRGASARAKRVRRRAARRARRAKALSRAARRCRAAERKRGRAGR
ncbi:MAG TPA: hypothetical protein VKU40_12230 [Thermoanaerobaculia bacterium]|nr:hypothetical protein [Thermoanaerobaculia bacterium]